MPQVLSITLPGGTKVPLGAPEAGLEIHDGGSAASSLTSTDSPTLVLSGTLPQALWGLSATMMIDGVDSGLSVSAAALRAGSGIDLLGLSSGTLTAQISDGSTTLTSQSVTFVAASFEALAAGQITEINASVSGTLSFLLVQADDGDGFTNDGIVRGGKSPSVSITSGPAWVSIVGDSLVVDDSGGPDTGSVTLEITDPVAPTITLTLDVTLAPQLLVDQSGSETTVTTSEATYTETLGSGEPWAAGDYTVTVSDVTSSNAPIQMPGAPAKIWNDGTQDTLQWWFLTDKAILTESIEWFDGPDGTGTSLATGTQIAPSGWASVVLTLQAKSDASTVVGTATVTVNEGAQVFAAPTATAGDGALTLTSSGTAPAAPSAPTATPGDGSLTLTSGA